MKKVKNTSLTITIVTAVFIFGCKTTNKTAAGDVCVNNEVSYKGNVSPLIIKYCISCHGPDNNKEAFAEYSVIKSMADNGELYREVVRTKRMPKNTTMSQGEIDKIACWLKQGAKNN